jgi:hypothetical protein
MRSTIVIPAQAGMTGKSDAQPFIRLPSMLRRTKPRYAAARRARLGMCPCGRR